MSFTEKVAKIITGKDKATRDSDRLAANIQQRAIQKAVMEERGKQQMELARQKVRIDKEVALQKYRKQAQQRASGYGFGSFRQPQKYSSPVSNGTFAGAMGGGFSPIFGYSQRPAAMPRPRKKHSRPKTKIVYRDRPQRDNGFRVI